MAIKKKAARAKKAPAKKTVVKKVSPRKVAAKKAAAKKAAARKGTVKKRAPLPKAEKLVRKTGTKVVAAASLASILGISPKKTKAAATNPGIPDNIQPELVKYYQRLLDLRNLLEGQMTGLAKESTEKMDGYSLHMADSGTDNFDRDFALGLLSADQDALYEINEALKRIESDCYGQCELTGKNIPKARLNAIPWARFTVEAQAQLERDGAVGIKRLGKLGSVGSTGISDVDDDSDSARASVKEAK